MHYSQRTIAALAVIPLALAQTFSDCNPTNTTCPADTGLAAASFSSDFTQGSSAFSNWTVASGTKITYGTKGAEFTISKEGEAPTVQTDFYIFFGTVEVKMQAAPGIGIVSSIVLESDDLDEIDWEFLGGDTTQAETNYFGKGNTTTYNRAIYYAVSSPQTTMHTYTVDWTAERLTFAIDGTVVRTLNYEDANGGSNYPQTPMRIKLGNWAGGASTEPAGTVEWAGGSTDFTKAPFTMYVESVKITNAYPGGQYEWVGKTGSWESIKVVNGSSTVSSAPSSTKSATSTTKSTKPTVSVSAIANVNAVKQTDVTAGNATTSATSTFSSVRTTESLTVATTTAASSTTSSNQTSTRNSTATSSSSVAKQTTSGASVNGVATAIVSVLAMGMCFFMTL